MVVQDERIPDGEEWSGEASSADSLLLPLFMLVTRDLLSLVILAVLIEKSSISEWLLPSG
jgi:hypothetical protein